MRAAHGEGERERPTPNDRICDQPKVLRRKLREYTRPAGVTMRRLVVRIAAHHSDRSSTSVPITTLDTPPDSPSSSNMLKPRIKNPRAHRPPKSMEGGLGR